MQLLRHGGIVKSVFLLVGLLGFSSVNGMLKDEGEAVALSESDVLRDLGYKVEAKKIEQRDEAKKIEQREMKKKFIKQLSQLLCQKELDKDNLQEGCGEHLKNMFEKTMKNTKN